jgi:hypothetical protein
MAPIRCSLPLLLPGVVEVVGISLHISDKMVVLVEGPIISVVLAPLVLEILHQ